MPNFTRLAIKASFLKLLNEQPLNRISVRSIVEDCGINRNSFYYHFRDIPTLIEEIVKDEMDALIAKYPTVDSMDECLGAAVRYALENKRAIMHIYHSGNRDIYERYSMRLCEYVVTSFLNTAVGKEPADAEGRRMAVRFLKCELYGLMIDWIANGMNDAILEELPCVTELCRGLSDDVLRLFRKRGAASDSTAHRQDAV